LTFFKIVYVFVVVEASTRNWCQEQLRFARVGRASRGRR